MGESKKEIKLTVIFRKHLECFFGYGVETFGEIQSLEYVRHIYALVADLEKWYTLYPACRYLKTKDRIYRRISYWIHILLFIG